MPVALFSVHDKSGIIELASTLISHGWLLLASGGTANHLRAHNIPVREISDYTGSPEILSGRVKTLHPAIHAGLLARATTSDMNELESMGWETIDLVVVNLYPFQQVIANPQASLEKAIENIDIGGVALLRAAAKNWQRVTVLCDPNDYFLVSDLVKQGSLPPETRKALAQKVFMLTAQYDTAIAAYLAENSSLNLQLFLVQKLSYGENPHQSAELYSYQPQGSPLGGTLLQGKALSYNNLLDLDTAWRAVVGFDDPTVVIVKHNSPCGIASAPTVLEAYQRALASDPISAFGGIIACNQSIDEPTALAMKDLFIECLIAPNISPRAQMIFSTKKNLRLIKMPDMEIEPKYELRSVVGGILRQTLDTGDENEEQWKVVSQRPPKEEEWRDLRFAWKACQFVKSNAVVLAGGKATVGIGGGQPNRVDCVRIALERAKERAVGAVLASDAFFTFPDAVTLAAEAGVTAVIHPGGSVRDSESIEVADRFGMAMVVTGVRHFRH